LLGEWAGRHPKAKLDLSARCCSGPKLAEEARRFNTGLQKCLGSSRKINPETLTGPATQSNWDGASAPWRCSLRDSSKAKRTLQRHLYSLFPFFFWVFLRSLAPA